MVSTGGVENECVLIFICDDWSEGNTPESCACAAIARQDSLFCDVDGVSIVKIDLLFVIYRIISCIGKFAATEKSLGKCWDNVDHVGWCPYIVKEFCELGCRGGAACGEDENLG